MNEVFFGPWFVRVDRKDAFFDQRFTITGSDASDGVYPGIPGTSVAVTGQRWELAMEWSDSGAPWRPSGIQRSATYTVLGGLVVTLGADDGDPLVADHDYNDMILVVQNQDPALDPDRPGSIPYDFSYPEDMTVPGKEGTSHDHDHPPTPKG